MCGCWGVVQWFILHPLTTMLDEECCWNTILWLLTHQKFQSKKSSIFITVKNRFIFLTLAIFWTLTRNLTFLSLEEIIPLTLNVNPHTRTGLIDFETKILFLGLKLKPTKSIKCNPSSVHVLATNVRNLSKFGVPKLHICVIPTNLYL